MGAALCVHAIEPGQGEWFGIQAPRRGARGASRYRNNIIRKLEVIQTTTLLIEPECKIWDAYGMQRSGQ